MEGKVLFPTKYAPNLETKILNQNIDRSKKLLQTLKQGYLQEDCNLQQMLKNLMGYKRLSRQINTDLISAGKKQKVFEKQIDKEYWIIQSSEYEKNQFDTKINQIKNYQNKGLKKLFNDFGSSDQALQFKQEPNDQESHQFNLQILQAEEKARKALAAELSELKQQRNFLQNKLIQKRQSLLAIPKMIQNLKQASLPVQQKLNFSFHQTKQLIRQAQSLQQPLYIAFHKFNEYTVINKLQQKILLSIENTNQIIQQEKAIQKQNIQIQQQLQQQQQQQQEQHHGSQEEGQMPQHISKKERRVKSSKAKPQQLGLINDMLGSGVFNASKSFDNKFAAKCLKIVVNSPIRQSFNHILASECYPLTIVLKYQTTKNFVTISIFNQHLQAEKIFGAIFPHDHGLNLQSGFAFNFLQLFCGKCNLIPTTTINPEFYKRKQDKKKISQKQSQQLLEHQAQIFYGQLQITTDQILKRGQKKIQMCFQMAKFLDILCKTNINFNDSLYRGEAFIDHSNQEFNFINQILKEFQSKSQISIVKLSDEEYINKFSKLGSKYENSKLYLYRTSEGSFVNRGKNMKTWKNYAYYLIVVQFQCVSCQAVFKIASDLYVLNCFQSLYIRKVDFDVSIKVISPKRVSIPMSDVILQRIQKSIFIEVERVTRFKPNELIFNLAYQLNKLKICVNIIDRILQEKKVNYIQQQSISTLQIQRGLYPFKFTTQNRGGYVFN